MPDNSEKQRGGWVGRAAEDKAGEAGEWGQARRPHRPFQDFGPEFSRAPQVTSTRRQLSTNEQTKSTNTPPPPEHSKCWQGYRRTATLGHCWWECEMGGSTVGKFNVESPYNPAPSLLSPQPGEREGAPGRTSVRPGSRQHCSQ